jgi:hypothetical protein
VLCDSFREKRSLFLLIGILVLPLLYANEGHTEATQEPTLPERPFFLAVHNQTLSVKIENASLETVLSELAGQAGLKVSIASSARRDLLSTEFRNLPLEEGITRLLSGKSYALIYAPSGSHPLWAVAEILVYPSETGPPTTTGAILSTIVPTGANLGKGTLTLPAKESRGLARSGDSKLLKDKSDKKRAMTREELPDEIPEEELRRTAREAPDPDARIDALEELAGRWDEGSTLSMLSTLTSALKDSNEDVRAKALELLRYADTPVPIGAFADVALTDKSPDVRIEALNLMTERAVLGELRVGEKEVVRATLQQGLHDQNAEVHEEAQALLGELAQVTTQANSGIPTVSKER